MLQGLCFVIVVCMYVCTWDQKLFCKSRPLKWSSFWTNFKAPRVTELLSTSFHLYKREWVTRYSCFMRRIWLSQSESRSRICNFSPTITETYKVIRLKSLVVAVYLRPNRNHCNHIPQRPLLKKISTCFFFFYTHLQLN